MKYRIALLAIFVAPALWGLDDLVGALTASTQIMCPGESVGEDGEERPGPMRPEDTHCSVLNGDLDVATRTYEQQQRTQHLDRQQLRRLRHVAPGLRRCGIAGGLARNAVPSGRQ